jgi:hypothetical protein
MEKLATAAVSLDMKRRLFKWTSAGQKVRIKIVFAQGGKGTAQLHA